VRNFLYLDFAQRSFLIFNCRLSRDGMNNNVLTGFESSLLRGIISGRASASQTSRNRLARSSGYCCRPCSSKLAAAEETTSQEKAIGGGLKVYAAPEA
jgi:hypothetical protein